MYPTSKDQPETRTRSVVAFGPRSFFRKERELVEYLYHTSHWTRSTQQHIYTIIQKGGQWGRFAVEWLTCRTVNPVVKVRNLISTGWTTVCQLFRLNACLNSSEPLVCLAFVYTTRIKSVAHIKDSMTVQLSMGEDVTADEHGNKKTARKGSWQIKLKPVATADKRRRKRCESQLQALRYMMRKKSISALVPLNFQDYERRH